MSPGQLSYRGIDATRSTSAVVLAALGLLDARLCAAADAVKALFGPDSSRDMFRGLHIKPADADASLNRLPVAPLLGPLGFAPALLAPERIAGTRFERLRDAFDLSPFDLDVILIALAPEIDTRYERLFAFIQDDVTRKRPTVDVALNLLCANIEQKLDRLGRFAADAPLVRHGVIRVSSTDGHPDSPRLSAAIRLEETAFGFLLGHDWLDARIAPYSRLHAGADAGCSSSRAPDVRRYPAYIQGRNADEVLSEAARHSGNRNLLAVDVEQVIWAGADWETVLAAAFRVATVGRHGLLFQGADRLLDVEQRPKLGQLMRWISSHRDDVFLGGSARWESPNQAVPVIVLDPLVRTPKQGAAIWKTELERRGRAASRSVLGRVAATFPSLTANQIAAAVAAASRQTHEGDSLTAALLLEGARRQTRGALRGLAERVPIAPAWNDLVLPTHTIAQLREVPLRVIHRATVMDDWTFGDRRPSGRGTAVLFSGASGTGKTFAAAALAAELGRDLFRIDLAAVVSKYIGETEKNLARVFDAAEKSDCVLLFDEADALFGKRSEVRDAHDRYANQEVAYLLQRVESFGGLAILTTNLGAAIDEAFSRRLALTVHFPIPDEQARRQLWDRALPPSAPVGTDVDRRRLASQFPVSGGVIAKAALAAGFLAAESGPPISMKHLLLALEREAADLGIAVPAAGARA
jgi:hypothetical protein